MPEVRNQQVLHATEDRVWWLHYGERLEARFVALARKYLRLDALINPEKETDKTAPDLVVNGVRSDLKTQNTPFFTARRYKCDPQFTVTFNHKDYVHYAGRHPEIDIYYWVDWQQTSWNNLDVGYLAGVFKAPFSLIASLIEAGAPEHFYAHRQGDNDPNAKSSYLLDLREFEAIFVTESRSA